MARGIEKRPIFIDDEDRDDLLRRLQRLVEASSLEVLAWALMPNHLHLLARTRELSLGRAIQRLLTGYAARFNRRWQRVGHLFQNRFRSTLCEEETYLLELVRYIHLNPLRAGIVGSLEELDAYPYTGHSVLLGKVRRPWQAVEAVMSWFPSASARRSYREFVGAKAASGRVSDLAGGGVLRGARGWSPASHLDRGREVFRSDERILGSGRFVAKVIGELPPPHTKSSAQWRSEAEQLAARVVLLLEANGNEPVPGVPKRLAGEARDGLAYLWVVRLRKPGIRLAEAIGVRGSTISRAAERGRLRAAFWDVALTIDGNGARRNYVP